MIEINRGEWKMEQESGDWQGYVKESFQYKFSSHNYTNSVVSLKLGVRQDNLAFRRQINYL